MLGFDSIHSVLRNHLVRRRVGRVTEIRGSRVEVSGLSEVASVSDRVIIGLDPANVTLGEIVQVGAESTVVLPFGEVDEIGLADPVIHQGPACLTPNESWIGKILDSDGKALDGSNLLPGPAIHRVFGAAPNAANRRPFGPRIDTGFKALNTFVPIARGQRIGLFSAGHGVGKSTVLGGLARRLDAELVVVSLVGEKARDIREFADRLLGAEGMSRAIVVASTPDQPAGQRCRTAASALAIAEFFRNQGEHVLFLCDAIDRLADAHRELTIARGEASGVDGRSASFQSDLASLFERAGPGEGKEGDITAVFCVSGDPDLPGDALARQVHGLVDGHIILDRKIAGCGRVPAIDILRSASRSAAEMITEDERQLIDKAKEVLLSCERGGAKSKPGETVNATGDGPDRSFANWQAIDAFSASPEFDGISGSFRDLAACLGPDGG